MPLIIGLGHKARQGKGEVAGYIKRTFGNSLHIEIHSFATALRVELAELGKSMWARRYPNAPFDGHEANRLICEEFGIPFDENPPIDALNPWGKQRKLQQLYATEYRRAQDPDYWKNKAFNVVDYSRADVIVFDDMRFENEFGEVEYRDGFTWDVERVGWKSDVPVHASELQLDGAPFYVRTGARDGNLGMLMTLADTTFRAMVGHKLSLSFA